MVFFWCFARFLRGKYKGRIVTKKKTYLYHDNEGAWNSTTFVKLSNSRAIKQVITSSPPPFVERTIQTLKHMIYKRLEGLKIDVEKWHELVKVVQKKYNGTVDSTMGLTPNEACKIDKRIGVWSHMRKHARFKKQHPPTLG